MNFIANLLRKKENKFNHIISLGYNCEVTYRFLKYFKSEESNLFNWTYSYSIKDLTNALNNFDKIATGGFMLPNPLWECKNTNIRFHGKANMALYINNTATDEIIENDRKDLIERISYLKNKFLNIARDNSYKLFIYKIRDEELDKLSVQNLYNALIKIGAENFKLLVVFQESCNVELKSSNEIIFRKVKYFAPDDNVTDRKYKTNGWNKIYDEFGLINSAWNKKNKKYKFENS